MKQRFVSLEDREDGFTLVEILVTIDIIAVLAAIAIPVFLNQRIKAEKATLQSDLHSIRLAFDACKTSLGESEGYPDVYYQWSSKTTYTTCGEDIKLSQGIRTHSFDMNSYYAAIAPKKVKSTVLNYLLQITFYTIEAIKALPKN